MKWLLLYVFKWAFPVETYTTQTIGPLTVVYTNAMVEVETTTKFVCCAPRAVCPWAHRLLYMGFPCGHYDSQLYLHAHVHTKMAQ